MVVLGVRKLGTLAHTKLSVRIRGLVELGARSVVVLCCCVVVSCRSVVGCGRSVVVLFFRFYGNSVAFVRHRNLVFAFVYIFRSVGGAFSV